MNTWRKRKRDPRARAESWRKRAIAAIAVAGVLSLTIGLVHDELFLMISGILLIAFAAFQLSA
jgi:hypothetical protein